MLDASRARELILRNLTWLAKLAHKMGDYRGPLVPPLGSGKPASSVGRPPCQQHSQSLDGVVTAEKVEFSQRSNLV